MKVKQLIEQLQKFDEKSRLAVSSYHIQIMIVVPILIVIALRKTMNFLVFP